jgi:hypothetical protein
MRLRTLVASTLLAALAGCASCDSVPGSAVTDCNAQVVPGGQAADILVVIDDSGSMQTKQDALASNLSDFIEALTSSAIALDLRIGVTNTSVDNYGGGTRYGAPDPAPISAPFPGAAGTPYPAGALLAMKQDGTGAALPGEFLWGTDPAHVTSTWIGPRILANGPNLARDFKANVRQGDWGSGKEQPLRAMRASLEASMHTTDVNFGFLRSGARLAVIVLTDEDDCSESGTPKSITDDPTCHSAAVDSPSFDSLDGFVDYVDTKIGPISGQPPIVAVIGEFDDAGDPAVCTTTAWSSTTSAASRRLATLLDRLDDGRVGPARRVDDPMSHGTRWRHRCPGRGRGLRTRPAGGAG